MATQKPISTISYNTEAFLKEHLDDWVKAHIIQAYHYIVHIGEDGDKDHIHLRIEPNRKLDPMDLTEKLKEFDPQHPTKPLGIRPWRPSKEEDWFLYAVHDADYLALRYGGAEKGEKLPYDWSDIKASDCYDVHTAFVRAKASMKHTTPSLAKRLRYGEDPLDLITEGENVFTINAVMRALTANDYQRAIQELAFAEQRIERLLSAIDNFGLVVVTDDNGDIHLEVIKTHTESLEKAPQSPEEPTWCGATRGEWQELYESATTS